MHHLFNFSIYKEPFGEFTQIVLNNYTTGEYACIIPSMGAMLNKLVLSKNYAHYSIIDGYETPNLLANFKGYAGAKLSPFANRIKNGAYEFDQNKYQFPINRPSEGNAIHGFIYNKPFKVHKISVSEKAASVTLKHYYNGIDVSYPFAFTIQVQYTLMRNELICSTKVTNASKQKMPYCDGWHPYFTLQQPLNELFLQLPLVKHVETDEQKIPTGIVNKFETFKLLSSLANQQLDHCFELAKSNDNIATTILHSAKQKLSIAIWQQCKKNKYAYIQVYTPTHGKSIAIEPMSSNINAFNNTNGLIILNEKQQFKAKYGIQMF